MYITQVQGDALVMIGQVVDGYSALNITGCTMKITFRDSPQSGNILLTSSVSAVVATNGTFRVRISSAKMQIFSVGRYYFDIQLTDGNGDTYTVDSGILVITQKNS